MKRNTSALTNTQFDVLIIGGGIYGVCAAWDAALRGLSVALIEKDDFGAATSSNSLKIIHGGLRYLQHADFKRMRESISERRTLIKIAPHFVHPLPCVMPTYGHGLRGKELMAVALWMNDLIGFDRNRGLPSQKHLPRGKIVSKEKCKEIIPGVDEEGLTGGALWYDCQVQNSERMLISILRSAVEAGAVVANYVEMIDFKHDGNKVTAVVAKDKLTDEVFEISAKLIINNSGPWFHQIIKNLNGRADNPRLKLSAAMNLVVKRKLFPQYAVGIWSKSDFNDRDAVVSKGSRLLFITPWRNCSLVGTTHVHFQGEPGAFKIREHDIQMFIDELNTAYPSANLKREDVSFFYGGLLPAEDGNQSQEDVTLLKHYQIIDHKRQNGIDGLLTVISVKYTTARDVAEKTINYAMEKLDFPKRDSLTSRTPIFGGKIEDFEQFKADAKHTLKNAFDAAVIEHLVYNYGSEYPRILKYIEQNSGLRHPVSNDTVVLKAEIVHAVREEMAQKLVDVVRRRTELGTAGNPGQQTLESVAQLMASELGWNKQKIHEEITETKTVYEPAA